MMSVDCPLCARSAEGAETIYALKPEAVCPTHCCVIPGTQERALAWPRGRLSLIRCARCGLVFNHLFDPETQRFGPGYEETQQYSPTFAAFQSAVIRDLVGRHGLREKSILEIGCGKGSFLREVCAAGRNIGVGYDPAYEDRGEPCPPGVQFHAAHFTEDTREPPADMVVCRHTLEHILGVRLFIRRMVDAAKPGGLLVIEVPAFERIVRDGAFWDIYYEHATYWTSDTLHAALAAEGCLDIRVRSAFGDQYLIAEARRGVDEPMQTPWHRSPADNAQVRLAEARSAWAQFLARALARGQRVALWGSGSKGVGLLAGVGSDAARAVRCAVDINPHRHGRWMPGVGVRIVAPEDLRGDTPDLVVALNAVYRGEIAAELAEVAPGASLVALGDAP